MLNNCSFVIEKCYRYYVYQKAQNDIPQNFIIFPQTYLVLMQNNCFAFYFYLRIL